MESRTGDDIVSTILEVHFNSIVMEIQRKTFVAIRVELLQTKITTSLSIFFESDLLNETAFLLIHFVNFNHLLLEIVNYKKLFGMMI